MWKKVKMQKYTNLKHSQTINCEKTNKSYFYMIILLLTISNSLFGQHSTFTKKIFVGNPLVPFGVTAFDGTIDREDRGRDGEKKVIQIKGGGYAVIQNLKKTDTILIDRIVVESINFMKFDNNGNMLINTIIYYNEN